MAFRNVLNYVYVCDQQFSPRVLARIDGDNNAIKRNIAIQRRDNLNRPPLDMTDRTRLYINCNRSINDKIHTLELDPFCLTHLHHDPT